MDMEPVIAVADKLDAPLMGVLFAGGALGLSWAFKWFARNTEEHQAMLRNARTDLTQAEQQLRADLVRALEQCRNEIRELRRELQESYARIEMLENYRYSHDHKDSPHD